MKNHLVIFVKEPRIGRVKTRLARDIGKVGAWRFYRRMLHDIPRRLKKGGWQTWVCYSPDEAPRQVFGLSGLKWLKQGRGDLGDRMLRPAQSLPPGNFIVVGTDIPDILPSMIKTAFKQLGQKDVVFGPAQDGGFWLVGHKRHPRLHSPYKNVRWSHEDTLHDCLVNLKGRRVGFVETLNDIDTVHDLISWRKNG